MRKKYPHLQIERKRNKICYYVRVYRGGKRIRVRAEIGSARFLSEYTKALQQIARPATTPESPPTHTLKWLVAQYMRSSQWTNELTASTRKTRSRYLARIVDASGSLPYGQVSSESLVATKEKMRNIPNSANDFVRAVRGLFAWAYESKLIQINPAQDLKKFKVKTLGHIPWTEEEVSLFRSKYHLGSRERLAFELLLNTGLRRSDVCRVGAHHIKNNVLSIRCQKNKTQVHIPISKNLREALENTPQGEMTLLSSGLGKPFTVAGFGNFFGALCRKIGINKSAHGLRKYLATELANAGSSERELMAFFGWANAKEAEVYTRNADIMRLARSALEKLVNDQV